MRQGPKSSPARTFRRGGLIPAFALVAALTTAVPLTPVAANTELKAASDVLQASVAEWRREESAYRAARAAGRISPQESDEYAEFLATLRRRVLEQCEVVRKLGGEAAVEPYECLRRGNAAAAAAVVVPSSKVLTEEEKRAAAQARLSALEGDIDAALLKRQQELREKGMGGGAGTGAAGTGRGSGAGGGGGEARDGSATGGGSGSSAGGGSAGTNRDGGTAGSPGTGAGSAGATGTGPTGTWSNPDAAPAPGGPGTAGRPGRRGPGTVGDDETTPSAQRQAARDGGSDDDVVARQLREAAERETDPVLKEKLWAEYRKYKEAKR